MNVKCIRLDVAVVAAVLLQGRYMLKDFAYHSIMCYFSAIHLD